MNVTALQLKGLKLTPFFQSVLRVCLHQGVGRAEPSTRTESESERKGKDRQRRRTNERRKNGTTKRRSKRLVSFTFFYFHKNSL